MDIRVTEKEMLKLKTGDKAAVTTDIYSGKTFVGTVSVIAPKGNDTHSYAVELKLGNATAAVGVQNFEPLRSGMYATAIFGVNENGTQSVVISRKAIVGGMKDPQVFVVRNNKAHKVPVQIGQIDTDYVEITKGVSVEDVIVIGGQINLKEGMGVVAGEELNMKILMFIIHLVFVFSVLHILLLLFYCKNIEMCRTANSSKF